MVAPTVEPLTVEEVQDLLSTSDERAELYALLALNLGATGADLADIRQDQVDWNAGTITRERTKTKSCPNAPTVCYPLWSRTMELLSKFRSLNSDRVLLSEDGRPLVSESLVDGRRKRVDLVSCKFSVSFKRFRKTGATLLASSPYAAFVHHYLGHAPKTVADAHWKGSWG